MNKLHELIVVRLAGQTLGSSLHIPEGDSFSMIVGYIAFEQMQRPAAAIRAWQIQSFMKLGYLRTNQLLNKMVQKKILRRYLGGCGYYYTYRP